MSESSRRTVPPKARMGGGLLMVAGALGVAAIWLPWLTIDGQQHNLIQLAQLLSQAGISDWVSDPRSWAWALGGGGAVAVLCGLIGLTGRQKANLIAGIAGLVAAVALSYSPIWVATSGSLHVAVDTLRVVSLGYYCAAAAGVLAFVATALAFVGARNKSTGID